MNPDPKKLLYKHHELVHTEDAKVISHVQRSEGDWFLNTLMIDGYEVPFQYKRQKRYKALTGGRVNLTYYASSRLVAGMSVEVMKVVRVRRA